LLVLVWRLCGPLKRYAYPDIQTKSLSWAMSNTRHITGRHFPKKR
jgi:hypothetical protein